MFNPQWLELPISRTNFHGHKDVRAIEVRLYFTTCFEIARWMANSVDPDQTPRSAASDLGLHYLLRPVCLNTKGKYVTVSPFFLLSYVYSVLRYALWTETYKTLLKIHFNALYFSLLNLPVIGAPLITLWLFLIISIHLCLPLYQCITQENPYAGNEDAGHPAHLRSLIRAFSIHRNIIHYPFVL